MDEMSMVERVAKILHDEIEGDDDSDGGAYMRAARKGIAALREPTEEMVREGISEYVGDVDALETWQAMIDEALVEQ